jgi:UDP-N-acetylglucosamine 2-epimerase (non-hydrolysing)
MRKNRQVKIAFVFGTRPEAIKLVPVISELKRFPNKFKVIIIVSGQHREMLDQVLKIFNLLPDYNLNIMLPNQSLFYLNNTILKKLETILIKESPDLVMVHGDTPTSFAASLSSFYLRIPVAHVEAGLRTYKKYNPFPEEINRQLIDIIADLYFVPTKDAMNNLIHEGKNKKSIWITGNTVIDTAIIADKKFVDFTDRELRNIDFKTGKIILLTCHRRESWGEKMNGIFKGIKRAVDEIENINIVFPVHLNPKIKQSAQKIFLNHPRVHLIKPLIYTDIIKLIKECFLILTDSGGIQEEASYFRKPVLVLRDVTERPEGVRAGLLKIAGTTESSIYCSIRKIFLNEKMYKKMIRGKNPFGDGKASFRIRKILEKYFLL